MYIYYHRKKKKKKKKKHFYLNYSYIIVYSNPSMNYFHEVGIFTVALRFGEKVKSEYHICDKLNISQIYVLVKAFQVQKQPQRCSVRKGVLRNFTKFTGKHLCQNYFFNKVAGLNK